MKQHFFINSLYGDLHDTRVTDWLSRPLRRYYRYSCREIGTVAEFKATLRAGAAAWPGGYPLFLTTSDGGALHFDCARQHARQIMPSIASKANDGWRVTGTEINYEDADLCCDHCGERIESAYASED